MTQTKTLSSFALDIRKGLTQDPKYISSKYFYDAIGSKIFRQIMALPEYYLTSSEYEILENHLSEILTAFQEHRNTFSLIEMGPGDGSKTKILIDHFMKQKVWFDYIPIDISQAELKGLTHDLKIAHPQLKVAPSHGDFFEILHQLNLHSHKTKIILFMGSTIGNFTHKESLAFLKHIRKNLSTGDKLFIGFDLKKEPEIIRKAYNDSQGITRNFNLNLLHRINRELDGHFNSDSFSHEPSYNPLTGEAKSYLVSHKAQTVKIGAFDTMIHFKKWEAIYTELSQKFDEEMILELAEKSGFSVDINFYDSRTYFTNSLWRAI